MGFLVEFVTSDVRFFQENFKKLWLVSDNVRFFFSFAELSSVYILKIFFEKVWDRNIPMFVYLWNVNKSNIFIQSQDAKICSCQNSFYRTCSWTSCWWRQWTPSSGVQVWASLSSLSRFPCEACLFRVLQGSFFSAALGLRFWAVERGSSIHLPLPVSSWKSWGGRLSLPSHWCTTWRNSRREILLRWCTFVRTGKRVANKIISLLILLTVLVTISSTRQQHREDLFLQKELAVSKCQIMYAEIACFSFLLQLIPTWTCSTKGGCSFWPEQSQRAVFRLSTK